MSIHNTVASTVDDRLRELGDISASRVRMKPLPGHGTIEDCVALNDSEEPGLFELVDGTLVEKAMGYEASVVAATIARILGAFVSQNRLGLVSGADGFFRLLSSVRGPDVAFVSRERLPDGRFPTDAYPQIAPNLAVEVLSPGNTKAEMARKRLEYFHAGVELLWIIDCVHRSIAVYAPSVEAQVLSDQQVIDGGDVLPEFQSPVADFFSDLDIGRE